MTEIFPTNVSVSRLTSSHIIISHHTHIAAIHNISIMVVIKSRCCESIALVTFLTMASIALSASADCTTDLKSEAFQNFTQTMEILGNISNLPQMCLDTGGDVFGYSGTSTCGGD